MVASPTVLSAPGPPIRLDSPLGHSQARGMETASAGTRNILHRRISVDTPEHVRLDYVLADLGSRVAALVIDILVIVAGFALLGLVMGFARRLDAEFFSAAGTVFVIAIFLMQWGYFTLFEGLAGGRTPGKRALGLRVVHSGGEQISFQAALLRNLIRVVDLQPGGAGLLGAGFILASRRAQRIGDLVAGTIVVRDEASAGLLGESVPPTGERPGRPRLSAERFELLAGFVARRTGLKPAVRERVAHSVLEALASDSEGLPPREALSADAHLVAIYEDEAPKHAAHRSGASLQASLMARERREAWARYADLVRRAGKHGLKSLSEEETMEFGRLYRAMTADLARAQTYGASAGLLGRVRQWAGAGHNMLYRRRGRAVISAWHWVTAGFPSTLRLYWKHILLAGVLLYGSGTITFFAARADPVFGRSLAGPSMLERAENTVKGDIDAQYVEVEPGTFLASRLITNNVGVTFTAFAGGVLAGAGTFAILVFNGVLLGGVLGAYTNEGVVGVILAFVFPHGFIELTAICVAGGAGFGLGSALIMPGRRTRKEALLQRGRSYLGLVGGSVFMLVIAGLIEGYFSPSSAPATAKFAFGTMTALMLAVYFGFAGRNAGAPPAATAARAP